MKYLGQHFLKNNSKIKKILAALEGSRAFASLPSLDLKKEEAIIEIGPGHGELTKFLATSNQKGGSEAKALLPPKIVTRIIAIEKDKNLAALLQKKFASYENIEIIPGDALKLLPTIIQNPKFKIQNYKLVGNIPFYITGRLLRIISELATKPKITVLTIQKEVAQRICAKPFGGAQGKPFGGAQGKPFGGAQGKPFGGAQGKPRMNLLAASVQFWAKPEIIDYIPKKDFQPEPKVDAAIIRLKNRNLKADKNKEKAYYEIVRIIFKQPRKTIINNLTAGLSLDKKQIIACCQKMKIPINQRPQDLTIKKIKNLSAFLKMKSAIAG